MARLHPRRLLLTGTTVLVLGAAWWLLAPTQLGGRTSYVVTDGISMEPRFHAGDLAVVRRQGSYRVGEIVAYHNNQLHTIVLHRIVAMAGGRYVFKGDNNSFEDFEHPAAGQLVGSLWLHLPGAGKRLHELRSPGVIAALAVLSALLLGGAYLSERRRRRGRGRRATQPPPGPAPRALAPVTPAAALVLAAAVAALPFAVLAVAAFTRPAREPGSYSLAYRQSGSLRYSAPAPPGPVYPHDRAETGEPLFTRVLATATVRYRYRFQAAAAHDLRGQASLSAALASTSGWHTTLALGGAQAFRGDETVLTATLDLHALQALIRSVQASTAVGGAYTLTVQPRVTLAGRLAGEPFHAGFAPQIPFTLDMLELRPANAAEGPHAGAPVLDTALAGTATGVRSKAARIEAGPLSLAVSTGRLAAIGGLAFAALALLAAFALRGRGRRDEPASLLARHGHVVVPVAGVWPLPGVPVIDLEDIDALAQIADRYDRSILHVHEDGGEAFWVSDESGQFRYAPSPGPWASGREPQAVAAEAAAGVDVGAQADTAVLRPVAAFEAWDPPGGAGGGA